MVDVSQAGCERGGGGFVLEEGLPLHQSKEDVVGTELAEYLLKEGGSLVGSGEEELPGSSDLEHKEGVVNLGLLCHLEYQVLDELPVEGPGDEPEGAGRLFSITAAAEGSEVVGLMEL